MNFELPNIFARLSAFAQPKQVPLTDHRPVAAVLSRGNFQFYNPDALNFPDTMLPVVPGAGGYVAIGLGQVEQAGATWDRADASLAGPVREFFRDQILDPRVKHAG